MSEFKISCPSCQQHLACDESYLGIRFPCPKCGHGITLPAPAGGPSPSGLSSMRAAFGPAAPRAAQAGRSQGGGHSAKPQGNSWLATFFLAFFLGGLGVDRLYNGRIGLGVFKMLTGGFCGLWSFIDVILLLTKKYQDRSGVYLRPAKPAHFYTALAITVTTTLLSILLVVPVLRGLESELDKQLVKIKGEAPTTGFKSPEAVFEAMKADPDLIKFIPPEERPMMAYINFMLSRLLVAMQTDEGKKKEAEQAFTALIGKYNLADKLEINSTSSPDQDRAQAAKAFAGVDVVALNTEFTAFSKKFSTEQFSMADSGAMPVSLRDLKINGNEAKGTIVSEDGTENPMVFIKSGEGWFLSWEKSQANPEGAEAMAGTVSMDMSLIVTFDSEASAKNATAKSILGGANYNRSQPVKLEAMKSPLQQKLTFFIPLSETNGMNDVTAEIKKFPGVKDVQSSFAVEFAEAMRTGLEEAMKSDLTNGGLVMKESRAESGSGVGPVGASFVGNRAAPPFTHSANDRWGARVLGYSSQFQQSSWTAAEALGKPDTYPNYGDQPTAWASRSPDSQREYLEIGFDNAAPINRISIVETLSPGAVDKVSVRNPTSLEWVEVWSGRAAPAGNAARIFKVTFPTTSFPVDAVRIDVNSPAVLGWNEIDAVCIALDLGAASVESTTTDVAQNAKTASPSPTGFTALQFDGTNDWLALRPIAWDSFQAFTVEAWVRDWEGAVMGQGKVGDPENNIWISMGSAGSRNAYSGWESGRGRNSEFPIGPSPTGRWTHVAMSFDGTNQAFYVDGRLKRRSAAPRPGPFDMRRTLYIGRNARGQLRSLRVSTMARYQGSFRPDQSWKVDEHTKLLLEPSQRQANTLKDLSSNGHDAQIHGTKLIQSM